MSWDMVWDWLDKTSIVLGLSTIVSIGSYLLHKWRERKAVQRRKIALHALAEKDLNRSAILAITLGNEPIETNVKQFIGTNETLQQMFGITYGEQVPNDLYFSISEKKPINFINEKIRDNQLIHFENDLDRVYKMVKESGVNTLHLFYCGPSVLCAKIGAKFSNCCAVCLYHYQVQNQTYYYAGMLERPVQ